MWCFPMSLSYSREIKVAIPYLVTGIELLCCWAVRVLTRPVSAFLSRSLPLLSWLTRETGKVFGSPDSSLRFIGKPKSHILVLVLLHNHYAASCNEQRDDLHRLSILPGQNTKKKERKKWNKVAYFIGDMRQKINMPNVEALLNRKRKPCGLLKPFPRRIPWPEIMFISIPFTK